MGSDAVRLGRLLKARCVSPAGGEPTEPDRIVLVPAGASIAKGFIRARRALRRGETVRILGCGVTYPDVWPVWAKHQPNLSLIEIGVYEARTRMEASRPIAVALREWCDYVFEGLVDDLGGADIFSAVAASRLLQEAMDCAALVEGIRMSHRGAVVEVVDPNWSGRLLLEEETGTRSALDRLALPVFVALGTAVGALTAFRDYERGARSRAEMRAAAALTPSLWLALIPDRFRDNKHLVETLGEEALANGKSLGVLFIQSWGVGTQEEGSRVASGDALWPGLGPLREHFPERVSIAQAVMPDRRPALAAALVRGALASAWATARVMRLGPPAHATSQPIRLAKLLSLDVMRAVLAARAARQARAALAPQSQIVFAMASLPAHAAPERVLHRLGVPTAEYMHGLGADAWHGGWESPVGTRFVWARTDAEGLSPNCKKMVVAGLPMAPPRPGATGHRNILILTSYFHRNAVVPHGGTKRAPYQREILAIPDRLRAELPDWPLSFRWRPHPAEVPDLVQRAHADLHDVELSLGRPLEHDFAWADLIVSPHSSAAAQAIFVGVPVFVHLLPDMIDSPFTRYVSDSRAFQSTEEAVTRIVPCLRSLANRDPEALAPEHQAQQALAGGPSPRGLYDAVCEWAAASHGD